MDSDTAESKAPVDAMVLPLVEPPQHTTRHVVWNEDGCGGRLVLLVGYCPDTLGNFLGLFRDAQKSVPGLNADDATCGKVRRSDVCENFTVMVIPISGRKRPIKRFRETQWQELRIESY